MFSDSIIEALTHKERNRRDQNRKMLAGAVVGTITGIAVGVIAGLLLAPKTGKETREDIKQFARNQAENLRETGETLINKVNETIVDAKDSINKVKDKMKHEHSYFSGREAATPAPAAAVPSQDDAVQQEPAQMPTDTEL